MPNDLTTIENKQIAISSPMQLLQLALEKESGIDVIERLAALQREEREHRAKLAFYQAMHRAQSAVTKIGVNASNPQTHSRYATYDKLDSALRPIYTKEGFSLSFDTEPIERLDSVRVICEVSHQEGHTRTYRIDMPADGKGPKGNDVMSKTHATGAAISYGCRYLLKAIFNVAIGESDDDGNGASISQGIADEWLSSMQEATTPKELQEAYLKAVTAATKAGDYKAGFLFSQKRDELAIAMKRGQ